MPNTAGVAGEVHSLRELVHASQTAAKQAELLLRELRRLVNEDPVVFLSLILLKRRVVGIEVTEDDR